MPDVSKLSYPNEYLNKCNLFGSVNDRKLRYHADRSELRRDSWNKRHASDIQENMRGYMHLEDLFIFLYVLAVILHTADASTHTEIEENSVVSFVNPARAHSAGGRYLTYPGTF